MIDMTKNADSIKSFEYEGEWNLMRGIIPPGYICYKATGPITVDGRADEADWETAPWTDYFVDIEGSPSPRVNPRFRTRAKMLWDDEYFYVYAELEEPHVWGKLTEKNSIIFHDNDFEVFIDPDWDNHNYYEYEVNALGTVWELTLPKPYRNAGEPRLGTNLPGLKSAVHVKGTLNDPSDTDEGWSVEVAFPWKDLVEYAGDRPCPPEPGNQWRVAFSRVNWIMDIIKGEYVKVAGRPEDNWTWARQGIIAMHCPERWGFVQFSDKTPGTDRFEMDPTFQTREELMEVYHQQREFNEKFGRYARDISELDTDITKNLIHTGTAVDLNIELTETGYIASKRVFLPDGTWCILRIGEDSRIWSENLGRLHGEPTADNKPAAKPACKKADK